MHVVGCLSYWTLENRDLVLPTFNFICPSYVWVHVDICSVCVSAVKAVALLTLSYIADETQLDLLRLDFEMLQFFLNNIQGALDTGTHSREGYATHEVIRGLSLFAKNDFNKILMVAQGRCI